MNPFTSSIDRKGYLIWNIAVAVVYYIIHFGFNSDTILIVYYGSSLLLYLLLVVRRLQSTGLNMWLLLALLLPLANILLLIALFFIPPSQSTAAQGSLGPSQGFKVTIGVIVTLFLILCIAVGVGLVH